MPWEAGGLLLAMVFPMAAAWLYFITFADAPFMLGVYIACKVVQFSLPLAWIWLGAIRTERPSRATVRGTPAGLVSGLVMAAVLWAAYAMVVQGGDLATAAAPRVASRIAAIGAATPARFLAMTFFLSVVHSFLEEYYWRWFLFGRIREYRGGAVAGLVSSIAFAGHHVIALHAFIGPGRYWWMTALLSLAVVLGGGIWAWLYARTGTLLAPWVSHVLVDLCIFAIGYHLAWRLV